MKAAERKQHTRIDQAGPGRWRWCLVNAHDRMLVHFFGTAPECRAIDEAWTAGKRPGPWRENHSGRGKVVIVAEMPTKDGPLEVVRTQMSLTFTPCLDCHGSKAQHASPGQHEFPCRLVLGE